MACDVLSRTCSEHDDAEHERSTALLAIIAALQLQLQPRRRSSSTRLQLQLQSRNDRQQCRTPLMFSIVMLTARSAQYVASHPLGATETYMLAAIPITYEALESALEWSSSGGPSENEALLSRETGEVFLKSMHGDFGVELPDDIED